MRCRQSGRLFWKSLLRGGEEGVLFVCFPSWPTVLFLAQLNWSLGSAKQGEEESVSGRVAPTKTSCEFAYKMIALIRNILKSSDFYYTNLDKKKIQVEISVKNLFLVSCDIIFGSLAICRACCNILFSKVNSFRISGIISMDLLPYITEGYFSVFINLCWMFKMKSPLGGSKTKCW